MKLPLRHNATLAAFTAAGLLGGDAGRLDDSASAEDNALYYWIGLGIVVGSAVLSNLGVNVQKLSHVREEERPPFARRTYYTRPIWIIGMVLIVLGAIGDFEALGCILSMTDVAGTVLIIIGVVLSTVVNQPDDKMSLEELERQFFQPGFLVYLGVMVGMLGAMFAQLERIARLPRSRNEAKYRLMPFFYATASGIFGSFSVLLAKCASILLILTLSGENQFRFVTTYLFVGGMVATLVLQTDLLNRAIMTGDTLSVFPMFQCFWIGSSVIGGVVFYEKYTRFTTFEWVCLPIALACTSATHVASRAHFTSGHFGALMPLSPSHRAGSLLSSQHSKTFEDKDEHTPLRPDAAPPAPPASNGFHHIGIGTALSPRGHPTASAKQNGKLGSPSPRAYQRIVV
ncbi:hypothetical protein PybrP1_005100 [[Pythium] brassicae (nom. inval.)]|nr:hypothetical protein PybrP1_005100 [[Pythium] brassicae (nom. inval.)]